MFLHDDITGVGLPAKTVSLTFDDGPGPKTKAIAEFLTDQGICATFFVTGEHAEQYPDIIPFLVERRHLVGNHTFNHPWLLPNNEDSEHPCDPNYRGPVRQIRDTHQLISGLKQTGPFVFRPPWGAWRAQGSPISELPALLNSDPILCRYIGPISWDVNGNDSDCWNEKNQSAPDCAKQYKIRFEEMNRDNHGGIVLMHDYRFRNPNTEYEPLEMVEEVVGYLQSNEYTFVRLESVPSVSMLLESDSHSANANTGNVNPARRN